jgi:hypothetical protein
MFITVLFLFCRAANRESPLSVGTSPIDMSITHFYIKNTLLKRGVKIKYQSDPASFAPFGRTSLGS